MLRRVARPAVQVPWTGPSPTCLHLPRWDMTMVGRRLLSRVHLDWFLRQRLPLKVLRGVDAILAVGQDDGAGAHLVHLRVVDAWRDGAVVTQGLGRAQ